MIASPLENNSDSKICDTDSEEEDCVTHEVVRSDEVVDFVECLNDSASQVTGENYAASSELSQRLLLSKNNHIWNTVKDRSSGRTSSIIIVRINRGPLD